MTRQTGSLDFDATRPPSPFFNDSHHEWRAHLRRWVEKEIMPFAHDWDEAGEFPLELYEKAAAFGLTRNGYPEEYGGNTEGLDRFHGIVTSEELARVGAGGITASLMVHGIGLPPIINIGSDELKARIAPDVIEGRKQIALGITEPDAGSDVARLKTRARLEGDHYVVNGSKLYITGGMRAHYLTTAVRTGEDGLKGISLLLIPMDAEGVSRARLKKQGWWASDTAQIFFDDVRVPVENLIGQENNGFMGIMLNFNGERLGMAAGACAYARVCLEDAARYAQERETFGKRLADHQVIRHKIAEMYRQVNASTAYLDQCAWRVQNGETPVADLSMLKVQATLTLEFCAREAMQIMGGASYMRGGRVERIYREVRVNAIGGGSEEIMRDLTARQLGL